MAIFEKMTEASVIPWSRITKCCGKHHGVPPEMEEPDGDIGGLGTKMLIVAFLWWAVHSASPRGPVARQRGTVTLVPFKKILQHC